VSNPAIDSLIQSSLESLRLKWIPYEEITNIKPTPTDAIYYAGRKYNPHAVEETMIILVLLGSSEECTPTLVSEFARIYSLPTHKYNNDDSQFRRYSYLLGHRNYLIEGFIKYNDNYYMVADEHFYHLYSRYGFCTACGIL